MNTEIYSENLRIQSEYEKIRTRKNSVFGRFSRSACNSIPIKVRGTALCSVTFKNRTVPVEFYILPGSCQSILDRNKTEQFHIISIDKEDTSLFNPIKIIHTDNLNGDFAFEIASIIQQYPNNFKGLAKMKDYQVKLYSDEKVKPVAVPPRSVPYHLQLDFQTREDPNNEPAP